MRSRRTARPRSPGRYGVTDTAVSQSAERPLLPRLLLLGALWGAAFMFMRLAAPEFGAVSLAGARVWLAALLMLAFVFLTRRSVGFRGRALRFLLIGGVNTALPFLLYCFAALHIPAGYSAIANATTPIWSALIAWLWFRQALGRSVWFGIGIAFAGVYVLVGLQPVAITLWSVLGMLGALAGAALYAVAGYLINRYLAGGDGVAAATGMVWGAAIWLLLPTILAAPPTPPSSTAWAAVLALAVFCTAIGYILFFALIRDHGPQRATTVAFLFPAFAALWGWLVLAEPISANMLVGMGMVLIGTSLVSGLHRTAAGSFQPWWERWLLPATFAILPLTLRQWILKRVAANEAYFHAETASALASIRPVLPEADLTQAAREHRLTRFIDAADPFLSALREKRCLTTLVRIEGRIEGQHARLLVGAHFGGAWWILPWLRRALGGARFVAVGVPPTSPDSGWLARRWNELRQWRWRELNRIGGLPVIPMRGAVAAACSEWRRNGCVVALLDLPTRVVGKTAPVRFFGRDAWLPRRLLDAAVEQGAEISYLSGYFDTAAHQHVITISPLMAQGDADAAFAEYASRLEADIRRNPGRWHSWGEFELLFEPARDTEPAPKG